VVGAQKSHLHAKAKSIEEFSALMVDIYQAVPRPMLHIMDATRGMDGQMGPSGGRVLKLGMLLAARDGVAMDAVMAVMAGCEPGDIPMIRIAGERGLGPIEVEATGSSKAQKLKGGEESSRAQQRKGSAGSSKAQELKIKVIGDCAPIPGFRMPSMAGARTAGGLSSIFYPLLLRRPIPLPERCTRCKECFKTCPAQAISMKPTPVIDRKKCISCFCCAEVCPERAFRIPGFKEALWRNITRR